MLTSGYAGEVLTRDGGNTREFELFHKPYEPDRLIRRLDALLTV